MEVRKYLSALACIMFLSACGNPKTSQTVFPENGSQNSKVCTGQKVLNKFIVQWENGKFTVEEGLDSETFKKDFIEPRLNDIRHVEFDRVITLNTSEVFESDDSSDNWGQSKISASSAWDQGVFGQGVKVAVVDSFVDVSHPQILPRISINTGETPNNGVDDDGNGVVDDYYGAKFLSDTSNGGSPSAHGTHVSGIIAADSTKGPIQGVAPQALLVPAQFISDDGGGSLGDAILAMQYAAMRGAKIINASWGGAPCVESLKNSFLSLEQAGILVVVAAGNDGRDVDLYPEFPASFNLSNQITVAASSQSDFMTSWSNSGFNYVHVAAPGESIYSTVPRNSYGYMDGTSMAAPFVSGVAALLFSARPSASAAQVRSAILSSADVQSGHEFKVSSRGRVNVRKALEKILSLNP